MSGSSDDIMVVTDGMGISTKRKLENGTRMGRLLDSDNGVWCFNLILL